MFIVWRRSWIRRRASRGLLVVVLIDVGGWGVVAPRLPEGTFRMIPAVPTWEAWSIYLRAWFIFGLADTTAQTLMQRAFSAKNEQVAQNSFYIAGFTYIMLGMVPVIAKIKGVKGMTLGGNELGGPLVLVVSSIEGVGALSDDDAGVPSGWAVTTIPPR